MRTRLASVLVAVAASSATLGLTVPVADAAAAPKKVASKVVIKGYGLSNNSTKVTFKGTVSSKNKACVKARTVKLRQTDQAKAAGKPTKTNKLGKWKIPFNGGRIDPGNFKATVLRKTVKVNGKKIVCKADSVTYSTNTVE